LIDDKGLEYKDKFEYINHSLYRGQMKVVNEEDFNLLRRGSENETSKLPFIQDGERKEIPSVIRHGYGV